MWRKGVFTAIYLGVYANWRPGNAKDSTPALLQVAAASGITGAIAWAASLPFDCIKSVQQAEPLLNAQPPLTVRAAAAQLWATGGIQAFFRGLSVSTTRAALVTSSRLVAFECLRPALQTVLCRG